MLVLIAWEILSSIALQPATLPAVPPDPAGSRVWFDADARLHSFREKRTSSQVDSHYNGALHLSLPMPP
jgi:hypothetical protein